MAIGALIALVIGVFLFSWLSKLDGSRAFEVLFGAAVAIAGPVLVVIFWGNIPLMVAGGAAMLYGVWQASHAWAHHNNDDW